MVKAVKIISLPPERWPEAKRLRLEALRGAPTAFASSFADEEAFVDEIWIARLRSAFKRDGNLTLYAEVEGELIGMAGAGWSAKAKLRHVAEVYSVYISPARRGLGIASQLMRRLLDELSTLPQLEKVCLTVNRAGQPAISLYQRFGFEKVGMARRELCVDGQYYDLLYMERFLESG
ncbi:MAG: GNAT family N-acetyltransferase [Anaerolineae bacterium]|nr:GNAT family N-acetyltransferase [Anaerolineae bacterium]